MNITEIRIKLMDSNSERLLGFCSVTFDNMFVIRDLKIIQKAWADSAIFDYNEAVGRELARIDNLERVYWEAWDKSKEPAVTRTANRNPQTYTHTNI